MRRIPGVPDIIRRARRQDHTMQEAGSLYVGAGFACVERLAIMSGGTLGVRDRLLLGTPALVFGIVLGVVGKASFDATPGE
jgi:hypothetical protein